MPYTKHSLEKINIKEEQRSPWGLRCGAGCSRGCERENGGTGEREASSAGRARLRVVRAVARNPGECADVVRAAARAVVDAGEGDAADEDAGRGGADGAAGTRVVVERRADHRLADAEASLGHGRRGGEVGLLAALHELVHAGLGLGQLDGRAGLVGVDRAAALGHGGLGPVEGDQIACHELHARDERDVALDVVVRAGVDHAADVRRTGVRLLRAHAERDEQAEGHDHRHSDGPRSVGADAEPLDALGHLLSSVVVEELPW